MKILFLLPNDGSNGGYNGGGWIRSLLERLRSIQELSIVVVSFQKTGFVRDENGMKYVGIEAPRSSLINKVLGQLSPHLRIAFEDKKCDRYVQVLSDVVNRIQPDIIQVFGSETYTGLVSCGTSVPVISHIQGLHIPYRNAYLPPFFSWKDYIMSDFNLLKILRRRGVPTSRIIDCNRELRVLKHTHYYMGRTDWDHRLIRLFNKDAKYFHCDEILRDIFYQKEARVIPQRLKIVSTISVPLYKGYDLILKTANLLQSEVHVDFEWDVYGNVDPIAVEKKTGISHSKVNVILKGVTNAENLKKELLCSTVYVHPSYIDNSPNSLCEAQISGCTTIATYVGGVPSLIENGKTGFLVPANDPYQLASLINTLFLNPKKNMEIGVNGQIIAMKRHDPEMIIKNLLDVYNNILSYNG